MDSAAISKTHIAVVMILFLGFSSICGETNYLVQYDLTKTTPLFRISQLWSALLIFLAHYHPGLRDCQDWGLGEKGKQNVHLD